MNGLDSMRLFDDSMKVKCYSGVGKLFRHGRKIHFGYRCQYHPFPNTKRLIKFCTKTLSKLMRNYCVTSRKLLTLVKYITIYSYLYGRKFMLRTDHIAFKLLMDFKNPEGHVASWIERLQE